VLGHPSFALLLCSRVLANMGFHMLGVAVGWQLYALTGSALDLGLVGLAQFVPMVLLTLIVGQVADRYDRRLIAAVCQFTEAAAAGLVTRVVPDEVTLSEARRLAQQIAEKPPMAVRLAKESILKAFDTTLEVGLDFERKAFYLLFATEDKAEGIQAFLAKRPPTFKGR